MDQLRRLEHVQLECVSLSYHRSLLWTDPICGTCWPPHMIYSLLSLAPSFYVFDGKKWEAFYGFFALFKTIVLDNSSSYMLCVSFRDFSYRIQWYLAYARLGKFCLGWSPDCLKLLVWLRISTFHRIEEDWRLFPFGAHRWWQMKKALIVHWIRPFAK